MANHPAVGSVAGVDMAVAAADKVEVVLILQCLLAIKLLVSKVADVRSQQVEQVVRAAVDLNQALIGQIDDEGCGALIVVLQNIKPIVLDGMDNNVIPEIIVMLRQIQ